MNHDSDILNSGLLSDNMDKGNIKHEINNLKTTEDDFSNMLCQLELLNDAFSYYKTMLKHD